MAASDLKPFKKGHKKAGGRQKGTPNKYSLTIKESFMAAAQRIGLDGKGFGGLTGFIVRAGLLNPTPLVSTLGRFASTEAAVGVGHIWDLDKLTGEEIDILLKLSAKAQKPMIEDKSKAKNADVVDLYGDEYDSKVAEVLSEPPQPEKTETAGQ